MKEFTTYELMCALLRIGLAPKGQSVGTFTHETSVATEVPTALAMSEPQAATEPQSVTGATEVTGSQAVTEPTVATEPQATSEPQSVKDSAISQGAAVFPAGLDWTAAIRLATEQGMGAVALDGLDKAFNSGMIEDSDSKVIDFDKPEDETGEWEGLMYEAMNTGLMHEYEYQKHLKAIARASKLLRDNGLRMMVFKGYDMSRHYPNPTHRPMGDVDFYAFGEGDKADEVIVASGGHVKKENPKHSVFTLKDVTFENHKSFLGVDGIPKLRPLEKLLREVAHPVKDEKLDIWRPSATFNFMFLLRHMVAHFMVYQSIKLRHLADWGLFLREEGAEADIALAKPLLHETGIDRIADYFTTLAQEITGDDLSAYMIGTPSTLTRSESPTPAQSSSQSRASSLTSVQPTQPESSTLTRSESPTSSQSPASAGQPSAPAESSSPASAGQPSAPAESSSPASAGQPSTPTPTPAPAPAKHQPESTSQPQSPTVDQRILSRIREDILLTKKEMPKRALAMVLFRAGTFFSQRWKYSLMGENFFVQIFRSTARTLHDVVRGGKANRV